MALAHRTQTISTYDRSQSKSNSIPYPGTELYAVFFLYFVCTLDNKVEMANGIYRTHPSQH